jgi:hypothetical protein
MLAFLMNLGFAGGEAVVGPPTFTGPIPDQPLTYNVAMTPIDFSAYFTSASSYSIAGTLPTGVSFDTGTGVLSGTPTSTGVFGGIVVTGTNGSGDTDSNAFTITSQPPGGYVDRYRTSFGLGMGL